MKRGDTVWVYIKVMDKWVQGTYRSPWFENDYVMMHNVTVQNPDLSGMAFFDYEIRTVEQHARHMLVQ